MASSGTTAFNLDLSDIIEEAYELCGIELRSGYDYRTARRALDLLFLEWQNKGLNLFSVETGTQTLTEGTSTYSLGSNVLEIIEAFIRTDSGDTSKQFDQNLRRISVSEFSHIANKLTKGKPSLFFLDKGVENPTINLWATPDGSATYTLVYFFIKKIEDTGKPATNNAGVPTRYLPCMTAGLAYNLALKKEEANARIPILKQRYLELWNEVSDADRERASVRFVPYSFYN
jgi:hypothetical protein|tara:strand:- start:1085 stop:1777 length:693 start_codon:yes stop_codon:yes gene_type:complete